MSPTRALAAALVASATLIRSHQAPPAPPPAPPDMSVPEGAATVEQTSNGTRDSASLIESFDGLGEGFEGPQGTATLRNASDNSIAVGPNHIVLTVNSRMAIFTKKGRMFDVTGRALYGPVNTNNVFKGFGGQCEVSNNGDAVVRYDQLAGRWLVVMPLFRRGPVRPDQPAEWRSGPTAYLSPPGVAGQPGRATQLYQPPRPDPATPPPSARGGQPGGRGAQPGPRGPYSMCYAISIGPDPFGPYYRYEFLRPLFPDYPRPAIWSDGYYVPSSTGDDVIQKHACVVERDRMLKGEPAAEQCIVIDGVNFLNNADIDGGTQLEGVLQDDAVFAWNFAVNWKNPAKTRITAPQKIAVAPYHYLCGGQLTNCVPQPGSEKRLDAQGDKIMPGCGGP